METLNHVIETNNNTVIRVAGKSKFNNNAAINEKQQDQLNELLDKYRKEVLNENPSLEKIPMPFGCQISEGFNESFICLKERDQIIGFIGYNIESKILNETRLFIDQNYRGKGFAILLLDELLKTAQQNTSRVIYFYNLTAGGLIAVKKFENHIKQSSKSHLRFFYKDDVTTIVLEDEIGCSDFTEHEKLLPCFFPYKDDMMVFDALDNYIYTNYGRLLDMNSGYWCSPFGYRHPELDKSLTDGYFSHLFGYLHPPALSLVRKLCEISGMARVAFNTSGSSVIDAAIRMAWQYAQTRHQDKRNLIVSLKGGFYGSSTTGLEAAGMQVENYEYKLYLPDRHIDKKIDPFSSSFNPLEELIQEENLEGKIAAFIFEPVLGVRGAFPLQKQKLQAMMETCQKYDILTIADEISTGMGRTGEIFACKHYDISPDIICIGKPLTNGMFPLAALLFNQKVNSIFDEKGSTVVDYLYGSTLGGHPTGCMIALKIINILQEQDYLQKIRIIGERFLRGIDELKDQHTSIRQVHGLGMMLGIEFPNSKFASTIQKELRGNRINCIPEGRVLMLMPPYTISEEQIDYFFKILKIILAKVGENVKGDRKGS